MRQRPKSVVCLGVVSLVLTAGFLTSAVAQEKIIVRREAVFAKTVVMAAAVEVNTNAMPSGVDAFAPGDPEINKLVILAEKAKPDVPLDPMVQQFIPQFRPFLGVEFRFLKSFCPHNKDQLKLIAQDGEKAVVSAAKATSDWQQGRRQRHVNGVMTNVAVDARKIIQDALVDAVKTHISPAQADRYRKEIDLRRAEDKQTAVNNLVAKLDQHLVLSSDQREKVAQALSDHWVDDWCQSLQMFSYEDQYFPNIPENEVSPFLTADQKKVWSSTQRIQRSFWGGRMMGLMGEEEALLDIDVVEPAAK